MIRFENLSKSFVTKDKTIQALSNISLEINKGEIYGFIGYSGAGKSTLVRCINLLEKPTTGKVYLGDDEISSLSDKELRVKRRKIGMIFQQFNLLAQKSVLDNVMFPLEISGVNKSKATEKAKELLSIVGLEDRYNAYPSQLSGGQKQRVAIARALATDPEVLLCDEATSALDPNTTNSILELLEDINKKLQVTIVIITHEMSVIEKICDRVAVIDKGEIVEEGYVKDVFVNPQSKMAKQLIIPQTKIKEVLGSDVMRIVFDGHASSEPVISNISLKCNTTVNILEAKTTDVGGLAYGQILIKLPEDESKIKLICDYLDSINLSYKVGDSNGI